MFIRSESSGCAVSGAPSRSPSSILACGATVTILVRYHFQNLLVVKPGSPPVYDATQKQNLTGVNFCFSGAPSRSRTCNLCLRRATHYPVVLWVHIVIIQLIFYFANIASIKSSRSPSKTAAESVFSTFVRTSLTNWYGYKT